MIVLYALLLAAVLSGLAPPWAAYALLLFVYVPVTWMQFLAGMNFDRMEKGGTVVLPTDPDEWCNEPDAQRLVRYVLWLPAALDNYMLAQLAAPLWFLVVPIPWRDVGLTKLCNRMVAEYPPDSFRHRRSLSLRKRWLGRYDRRGFHT